MPYLTGNMRVAADWFMVDVNAAWLYVVLWRISGTISRLTYSKSICELTSNEELSVQTLLLFTINSY